MKAGMHLLCMSQLIDKQKSNNIVVSWRQDLKVDYV